MSAKVQVMLSVPKLSALRNVNRPASVNSKITKGELMKRLHKDNKTLFGDLVETKKEKTAREKKQKKVTVLNKSSVNSSSNDSLIDTELFYINNTKHLFKIKFVGKCVPNYTKKILQKSESQTTVKKNENPVIIPAVKNSKTSIPSAEKLDRISITENSDLITDAKNTKSNDKISSNERGNLNFPSDIIINKITSFSYLDTRKRILDIVERVKPLSISPYSDKTKLSIPSVTKILNKTMSPESKMNLEIWKQKMIQQLGQEGFEKYSQELLFNGKQFHSSIQNYLIREPFEVPSAVERSWQSVRHVLEEVNTTQVIESHVVHPKLYYRGVVDCVALYRGNLCVIDWKKSDKPKNSIENTFDAPIQVASYIGALNSDTNYPFQLRKGLVVVGYTNGDPATVHEISPALLNKYWNLWLRRLQQYYLEIKPAE